jgi:hypothetical protein
VAKDASLNNFGLLIAYLIPGFALLWGLRPLVPGIDLLLGSPLAAAPTVGGFLYATLAAVGAGMVVSTARWLVIDSIHHATGLRPPQWDFARLGERAAAFDLVVEHYYRYYQFHANTCVSLLVILAVRWWAPGSPAALIHPADLGLFALIAILFAGSRDSLRRYYTRGGALLGMARRPPSARRARRTPAPTSREENGV